MTWIFYLMFWFGTNSKYNVWKKYNQQVAIYLILGPRAKIYRVALQVSKLSMSRSIVCELYLQGFGFLDT